MRREPGPIEALIAEALGAFLLTFVGAAATVGAAKGTGLLMAALGHGFMLFIIAITLGRISGAHVNPAVTLSLAAIGKFRWSQVPGYVVAQFVGGFLAAWLFKGFYNASIAPTRVGGASDVQLFLAEAIGAAILVFTIVAVATDTRLSLANGIAPFAIGMALMVGIFAVGNVSNAGLNPALSFGPYLFNMITKASVTPAAGDWLGYLVGPVVGGVVAAFLYQYVSASLGGISAPAGKRR